MRIVIGALAVLTLVGCASAARPPHSVHTGQTSTSTPSQAPSPISLTLIVGHQVRLPDGRRINLALPDNEVAAAATRLPGGYLVSTDPFGTLWWVPDGEAAVFLGGAGRSVAIWPDRSRIAFVGGTTDATPTTVATARLPSGRQDRRIDLSPWVPRGVGDATVTIAGVTGDRVVVRLALSYAVVQPARVLIWNVRTGRVTAVAGDGIWLWSVAGNGRALRRVDRPHPATRAPVSACIDVVDLGATLPAEASGVCGAGLTVVHDGALSPDAAWALFTVAEATAFGPIDQPVLARTADLSAGLWRPYPISWPGNAWFALGFWDSATAFIGTGAGSWLCTVDGPCRPVLIPADARSPAPAQTPAPPVVVVNGG
jgi:hypothetical protein